MFLLEIHDNSSFVVFKHLLTFHLVWNIWFPDLVPKTEGSNLNWIILIVSHSLKVSQYTKKFLSKPLENLFTKFEIQTFL